MAESVEAPVVKAEDAAKSMSAIKKKRKKKISKNVLGLPDNAKIKPPIISEEEELSVAELLKEFLPAARVTIKPKKGSANSNTDTADHDAVNEEAKKKRLELCIGVNALTRGIKDDKVAAALIAGDITPSQLAAHLNFKCTRKNIPYLYVSNMRQCINEALGFPCIALGFKKGCDSFVKIVKKISKLHRELKQDDENLVEEVQKESESEEENSALIENTLQVRKEPEKPVFSYLYRSSCKERVFIPEEVGQRAKQTDNNFIAFNTDEKEVKKVMKERWNAAPGISHNIIEKFKKEKKIKI